MKQFWRIVIGSGMVIFGMVGLFASFWNEDEPLPAPGIFEADPTLPAVDFEAADNERATQEPTTKQPSEKKAQDSAPSASPTPEYSAEDKKADRELFRELVKERAVERCAELISEELQTSCADSVRMALALRDTSLKTCDLIESQDQKTNCRDQVLLAQAKTDNEYSLCLEIMSPILRERCQDDEARHQITQVTNINDCEKIQSRKERDLCFDFFTAKRAIAAIPSEGADACGDISNEDTRNTCLLENAIHLADRDKNIAPCRELEDAAMQTLCIQKVGAKLQAAETATFIDQGLLEGCAALSEENGKQYCIDNTLFTQAVQQHDPSLCQGIETEVRRERCQSDATEAQSRYYFSLAQQELDIKWCRLISDVGAQQSCTSVVSQMSSDES